MQVDSNNRSNSQQQTITKRRTLHKKAVLVPPSHIYDFLIYPKGLQSNPKFSMKNATNEIAIIHFMARHMPMATPQGKDTHLKDIAASGWWGTSYICEETGIKDQSNVKRAIRKMIEKGILIEHKVKNGRFLAFSTEVIEAIKAYTVAQAKKEIEEIEKDDLSTNANQTGVTEAFDGGSRKPLTGVTEAFDRGHGDTQSSKGKEGNNEVKGKGGSPHPLGIVNSDKPNRVDLLNEYIEPYYVESNGYIKPKTFKKLNQDSEAIVSRYGFPTFKSFCERFSSLGTRSQLQKRSLIDLFNHAIGIANEQKTT